MNLRFLVEFLCIGIPPLYAMTIISEQSTLPSSSFSFSTFFTGATGDWSFLLPTLPTSSSSVNVIDILWLCIITSITLHITSIFLYKQPLLSINTDTSGHAIHWLINDHDSNKKDFISYYRSGMMILTIISILAVDFPVFPRRYVKCETFGTSVMDMGVGAFVLSASLVSRQARRVQCTDDNDDKEETVTSSPTPSINNQEKISRKSRRNSETSITTKQHSVPTVTSPSSSSLLSSRSSNNYNKRCGRYTKLTALWETTLAVSPLLALGFIRLIAHALVNYQVHESEYGRHWNFFFTMASVAILATLLEIGWDIIHTIIQYLRGGKKLLLSRSSTSILYITVGLTMAILYQLWLMSTIPNSTIQLYNDNYGNNNDNNNITNALFSPIPHSGDGSDKYCHHLSSFGSVKYENNVTDSLPPIRTVQQFILCAPRTEHNIILQNREGIAGVLGFFAIYLCGLGLGIWLLTPRKTILEWQNFYLQCVGIGVFFWIIYFYCIQDNIFGPVSRRLVNASYVLWVLAFNWSMLISLLTIDMVTILYNDRNEPLIPIPMVSNSSSNNSKKKNGYSSSNNNNVPVWLLKIFNTVPLGNILQLIYNVIIQTPIPLPLNIRNNGSIILESININFLAVFLIANLLVGVVNLTVYTVYANNSTSMGILILYTMVVAAIATIWRRYGVSLKFW
jgi:hypothetical protein